MKQRKGKNWKTTVGGLAAAVGMVLAQQPNSTLKTIGEILGPVGLILLGGTAKDNNVTGGTVQQ